LGKVFYDVIWIERLNNIAHSQHINGKWKIMDFDDIQHFIIERTLKLKHRYDVKKYYLSLKAYRTHILEKQALRTFDKALVCSEKNRHYLNAPNVEVIENCIDVDSDAKYTAGQTGHMLFIGNLGYHPNDEGMQYFIKSILPRIHNHLPKATLTIIGEGPCQMLIKAVEQTKGVHLTGFVPNIEPYYTAAQLSIVPLRIGGGTRIKILESLAKKVPVVSTFIGAEGLNLIDHEHILIADDPREFAAACIKLLKNQALREKIALSGFRCIRDLFSPQ
jgi:glycosyltransferase involved in cell wall biosynthesis